ncbi:MAG: AAA family ATPase [Erysipelotrichaceae bacterium]|nr:AAA family ATPase [Erysipelotrichaceae bacterium]
MADRKKEKEKLMEKVFGKDAPNRRLTEEDMELLRNSLLDIDQLSPEWKTLKENSEKLQQQSQKILDSFTDADLEQLRNEIRKDFGDSLPVEAREELTVVHSQLPLNAKYEEIEARLNEEVLCQKDYNHKLVVAFRRPTIMGVQPSGLKNSILITGQKATGRHTSVTLIARLLKERELITNDELSLIDLSQYSGKEFEANLVQDLYTAVHKSSIIVFDNLETISANFLPTVNEIVTDGQLTLSKRYTLSNKQLVETATSLVKDTVKTISFKGKYLVFLTTLKVEKLLDIVGARFINTMGDVIKTKDIVKEDLEVIYPVKLKAFQKKCLDVLKIDVKASQTVRTYLADNFIDRENVRYLNNFFDRCYEALAEYKLKNMSDEIQTLKITAKDNQIVFVRDEEENKLEDLLPHVLENAREEARKELDQLVGLEEIKKYILSLEDFYEAQKIREKQGLKTSEVSKHMIFTGNPGTGKTTIARVLAKYLKSIGVLSNGQLIEVSRNDLVGKYMGHTAPQTMQVINSAMGGILFIDEAYSLYRGTNDSFGLEAIDTLVKAMEDNRDDLIVILAGYTKEMKTFLESNSGLASRFPNQIEFPDYTAEELYAITEIQAKSKGYRLHELIKEPLTEYYRQIQANDSQRSGNGRLARNVVEEAIINQSKRIINDKDAELDLILVEDIDFKIKSDII